MRLQANGIQIEAMVEGPAGGEPLLLIMGLGMQLIAWPQPFVDALTKVGFRVIRFDNRDSGLSQGFDHLGVPNILGTSVRHALGLPITAPYSLDDMARDALGVLDALGIPRAHVCGVSMGGMVAQVLAATQPQRVKSLCLMMTSSGARRLPGPSPAVRRALLRRLPRKASFDQRVEHLMRFLSLIGSPRYVGDDTVLRERIERAVRRAWRPGGVLRQLTAIAAHGDRSPLLGRIIAPTLVVHGEADPLVPLAAALDLKAKIAGARLDRIEGMGHDLPEPLLSRFAGDIEALAEQAGTLL
jgi:pimeloyl-ACP methyl ester carboxylesterase